MKGFAKGARAVIQKHGGQPDESAYEWMLDTKFGPLHLSVNDDSVMTRFDFPKVAHPETACNPYSGKWNHHYLRGCTPKQALADLDARLKRIKPTSPDELADATNLVPDAIIRTVIQERGVNLSDPPYAPELNHGAALQWFVGHVVRRLIFLFDTDPPFTRLLKSDGGRDALYAFVSHWLDAYLNNPLNFRRSRSLL